MPLVFVQKIGNNSMDTISRNIKITRKELKNVTADVFNTNMTKTFIMIFMIAVMILFFIVMSVDKQALGVRFASYLATFIVVILSGFLVLLWPKEFQESRPQIRDPISWCCFLFF